MQTLEFICLANSRKLGGSCVAGIRTDTGAWIRPVSSSAHGELSPAQQRMGNDEEPRLFDLVRVQFTKPVPSYSQPENWLISDIPWDLVNRPAPSALSDLLMAAVCPDRFLFGSISDRVAGATLAANPATSSLTLIRPQRLRWFTDSYMRKKKARAQFYIGDSYYNLGVTDPSFEPKLKSLADGYHEPVEVGLRNNDGVAFTISLSEPADFDQNCYKLVAAVLTPPNTWPEFN